MEFNSYEAFFARTEAIVNEASERALRKITQIREHADAEIAENKRRILEPYSGKTELNNLPCYFEEEPDGLFNS